MDFQVLKKGRAESDAIIFGVKISRKLNSFPAQCGKRWRAPASERI
jgi:hypothetical protein